MANVGFRNGTSAQGNPLTSQSFALPTIVAGDLIVLGASWQPTGAVTISGAGTWTHQGTDGLVAAQVQMGLWTAISVDGSESGANVTINVAAQEKFAAVAASYSGVSLNAPIASGPTYATFTTSNTTSATSPSVSPVNGGLVIEAFASKSSTNTGYSGIPAALTQRVSVVGTGAGATDYILLDSNGIVTSAGGHTVTESVATANKVAMTLVLNPASPIKPQIRLQAVSRSAFF